MSGPTFVRGFIPSPDVIRNSLGPIAANVFGVVWMYSQMRGRECYADLTTIAANSGFKPTATRTALRKLEAARWIEAEARPGRTTVYRDCGRWGMSMVGEVLAGDAGETSAEEPTATPTRDVAPAAVPASAPEPQRVALPTPTPDVAPPQRVALPNILEEQTRKHTTPTAASPDGDGGDAPRPPAAPADTSQESADQDGGTLEEYLIEGIETLTGAAPTTAFAVLCWAMGLDSARLTAGGRAQIAKEAKRLRLLEGAPGARELLAWCDRERRAVAARYGAGRDPEVMWYITAIGKGIASRRRAALEAERRAAAERAGEAAAAVARAAANDPAQRKATQDWRSIVYRLRASLPPGTFETWLAEAKPRPAAGGGLRLELPTERHVEFCRARLLDRYLAPAARELGVVLELAPDPALLMAAAPGYTLPAGFPAGNPVGTPGGF